MSDSFEYADALPDGLARGRGAGLNPGNRFESVRLHVLGEHLDELMIEQTEVEDDPFRRAGEGTAGGLKVRTRVFVDRTRTLINHVDPSKSPDIPFEWSINPYRGCEHGCVYCYARPGHEYLGMSMGLDFETKILAKLDAAKLLRRELASPKWRPQTIAMSGVTDPYQPVEAKLRITRGCLEVFAECRQPVGIVTKNHLVTRDLDLLKELANYKAVRVGVSVTTLDTKLARVMEPRASSPADRLRTIRELTAAGVPTIAMVAPIIPGLNDREIPSILEAVSEAGAIGAGYVMLRLPYQIKALFLDWLARQFPDRAAHVESLIRQTHDGELYDSRPGVRQRGEGAIARQIGSVFKVFERKHGLDAKLPPLSTAHFRRPRVDADGQMTLF